MYFTVAETNLVSCFDTSSRSNLITEMKNLPLNDLEDEMAELLFKTVQKLEAMTDAEFSERYIMPDGMIDDKKEDSNA